MPDYAKIWEIQQLLQPRPDLITGNRFYIREGEVLWWNPEKRNKSKRYLYLFNDILLITKKQSSRRYLLKLQVSLKSSGIKILDVATTTVYFEFQLHCRATQFIFFAYKQDDKENWLENFQLSIQGEHPQELRLKSILSLEEDDSTVSESLPVVEKKHKKTSHRRRSSSRTSLEGSKLSPPKMLSASSGTNDNRERRRSQPRPPPRPLAEEVEEEKEEKEPLPVVEEKEPPKTRPAPLRRQRSSSYGDASQIGFTRPVRMHPESDGVLMFNSPLPSSLLTPHPNNPFLSLPRPNPFSAAEQTKSNPFAPDLTSTAEEPK